MKIEKVKIAELNPAEYNPRRMTNKQYEDLKNSLEKFGLVDPIIINSDNTVVGGHQRLRIMRELGAELVPVVRVNLSKEDEKELNIRLNKNTGEFDLDVLANNFEIDELKDWGFKDIELGFNIDKIVEGNIEDDHIPEVKETKVKLGDVWELGKHRLMCGDSTKESDVEKLMNGDKAELLFTDPPYGISVVSKKGNIGKGVLAKEGTYREVLGDDKFFDPTFLLSLCDNQIIWGANYFHNLLPLKTKWIVWDKDRPEGTTFSDCELAWTSIKGVAIKKYKCTWNGMIREGESEKRIHPTQKPLKICKEILNDYSKKNNKILDLFLGSGSTLIACEKTNRVCYGMELDTKYCDVIIERWEQFTGQKAKKCGV